MFLSSMPDGTVLDVVKGVKSLRATARLYLTLLAFASGQTDELLTSNPLA